MVTMIAIDSPVCPYGSVKGCICNVCLAKASRKRAKINKYVRDRYRSRHTRRSKQKAVTLNEAPDFNKLVLPHRSYLVSRAKQFTGQEHTAEDLVQETLIKAYSFWFQFKPESENLSRDAKFWLCRILSNIFYSQYAKTQRHSEKFEIYESNFAIENEEDSEGEDLDKIRAGMEKLVPKHREILELFYTEGLTYKEVAQRYSIKPQQAQKKLWQARQALRRVLLQAGFADDSRLTEVSNSTQAKVIEIEYDSYAAGV